MEIPNLPQSLASVDLRSADIDIVIDLSTDQEQFDLEADAERINLNDVKEVRSMAAPCDSENRRSDRDSPSSRTSRRNTPDGSRKRRSISSRRSVSSSSSSSSSDSSSSSSESDEPYYLDRKREKERIRKLKRYRTERRHNRRHSRERRSHTRERRRSSERRDTERRDRRRRSNPERRQIIIVPTYMHQAAQMMPYMPYFQQQMIPSSEFHGPMQMPQMHQIPPGLPMAPFMGRVSTMPAHGRFQSMPLNCKPPNKQSFHWKKWKKQKKPKTTKSSEPNESTK